MLPPETLSTLVALSRPRFWLYLGGTYLIGFTAGADSWQPFRSPVFWVTLLYFLLPANLLLYGINDLFDQDTDRFNPKKGAEEHRIEAGETGLVRAAVGASFLLSLAVLAILDAGPQRVLLVGFLVLSAAYSTPPVRLKARPFFDAASNVLYALPAFIGYHQTAGHWPAVPVLVIGLFWTAAMHLFSAIPDIESDRQAGLATSATALGEKGALLICALLWAACLVLLAGYRILWPWSLLVLVYALVPLAALVRPASLTRLYWAFPVLNGMAGMLVFFVQGVRL